ncbi:E3 ubiquitin-protein ligase CHIP [Cyphellophora attinorum]|uniref:E3 ubiquitin-protein ligase CHIP n=1 Tax=Cyphellophora attinorum TaxID=1664694 RepID=A0A0N1HZE0_9EURO|nr:E3 ubiquitin-protein ligase CHIP [Phialophora attinorum]KPI44132.1 E3 ubiquitin-protein ligase CHIP [Phialophora attinorum]
MSTFKDLGNEHFKAGQFKEAEQLYTEAQAHSIQSQSRTDPKVFQNRALARIRLSNYSDAESDARKALELWNPKKDVSMKAHYYLAQSLLSQRHVGEALNEAQIAYRMALSLKDSSAELISQFILRAKQAQWSARETARLRELSSTLAAVEDLLDRQLETDLADLNAQVEAGTLGATGRDEERSTIERISQSGGGNTAQPEYQERKVPDYLIDTITFEVMHDPVVTPSGASYERVGLLKHLKATGLDPLTREPLTESQLYPNVALRNACATFLEENGWAVDY